MKHPKKGLMISYFGFRFCTSRISSREHPHGKRITSSKQVYTALNGAIDACTSIYTSKPLQYSRGRYRRCRRKVCPGKLCFDTVVIKNSSRISRNLLARGLCGLVASRFCLLMAGILWRMHRRSKRSGTQEQGTSPPSATNPTGCKAKQVRL
jgi:hypothetical protein